MRNPFKRQPPEQRLTMKEWTAEWGKVLLRGLDTKSGQSITALSAIECSTVHACIKVISETIASLPLFVYRTTPEGGKEPARNDPRFKLLHDKPNPFQTAFEWKEMLGVHNCLHGNFIAYINKTKGGKILGLIPLDPTAFKTELEPNTFRQRYEYKPEGNEQSQFFYREELVHVRMFSSNGLWGLSPRELAKEQIGLSLGTEEYAAKYFANDATPGGVLEHPGRVSEDAAKRLVKHWNESHDQHKTRVLEEGMKFVATGKTNEESQFIEARGFQVEEIARIYRVPCILIGHPNNTMTYASAEQFFISFVTHTMRPWLVRIEQVLNAALFPDGDLFCEFNLDALLRGDTLSRYQAHSLALQNKFLTRNEVRLMENKNPIPGGDEFENPAITVKPNNPDDPKNPKEPKGGKNDEPTD